jgi:hypothetical protein
MSRVEWSALSGDEVETVLANLLYNAHDRALRIRPSQGDYGIDVAVPTSPPPELWDIYQIKKFAQNLTAGQKTQIENSFRRVLIGLIRRGVPLGDWYLVTPLDPTLENQLDWFRSMPDTVIAEMFADEALGLTAEEQAGIRAWRDIPGRIIDWKGLPFCDGLAGRYGYVIDYYLHGGRERLRDAVADLSMLLRRDQTLPAVTSASGHANAAPRQGSVALLEPGEVREHLQRLHAVLDTDPHFRYGISLDPQRPELRPEPGLLAAQQETTQDGRTLTFKIFARSAQSLDERQIPLELTFNFEGSSEGHEAFEAWRKYGKPLETNASVKIQLPGGLGGSSETGRVRLSPAEGKTNEYRLRLRVVTPDGAALSELGFAASSTTGLDGTGAWVHCTDDSGVLETDMLLDATAATGKIEFTLHPLADRGAAKSLAAVVFASHLRAPNRVELAGEYGPFSDLIALPGSDPLVDPAVARLVGDLTIIQTRAVTEVVIPDASMLSPKELQEIRRAASLIEGHTVVGTWTEMRFDKDRGVDLDPAGHYQFAISRALMLTFDGQEHRLGSTEEVALSAEVASIESDKVTVTPHLNDTVHIRYLPPDLDTEEARAEGKPRLRYRRLPDV